MTDDARRVVDDGGFGPEASDGADDDVRFMDDMQADDRAGGVVLALPRVSIDIFVTTGDVKYSAERFASDRRVRRCSVSIKQGGLAAAGSHYATHQPAAMIVVETGDGDEDVVSDIERLASYCPPETRVIVIGGANDVCLYRNLLRIGVSDYLLKPVAASSLVAAVGEALMEDEGEAKAGAVTVVMGARGGAGASTIAHNLACAFSSKLDTTTALLDLNPGFGVCGMQFDLQPTRTLADAVKEGDNLDADVLDRLIQWRDKRLGILAAPAGEDPRFPQEPGRAARVLDFARRIAQRVVVDAPSGWSTWTEEAIENADSLVIVATPDLPSLRNARMLRDALKRLRPNDQPPAFVLNRLRGGAEPLVPATEFERVLNTRIAARIVESAAIQSAEMNGRPLLEAAPESAQSREIAALAVKLSGREPPPERRRRAQGLLGRLIPRRRG